MQTLDTNKQLKSYNDLKYNKYKSISNTSEDGWFAVFILFLFIICPFLWLVYSIIGHLLGMI